MERKKGTILAAIGIAVTLLLTAMPATVATAPEGDVEVITLALPPFTLVDMPLVVSILVYNGEDEDVVIDSIYVCMEDDDDVLVTSKAIDTSGDWWESDLEEDEGRLYVTSFIIPETYGSPAEDVGGDSYDVYANVTYHIGTDTGNATTEESDEQMVWVGDPINDFLGDLEITIPFLGNNNDDNDFFFFGSNNKDEPYTVATGTSPEEELQLLIPEVYPSTNEAHTEPSMNWDNVMY